MKRRGLLAKVREAVQRLNLTGPGVVAVSGGPDSVALLRALVASRPGGTDAPLIVAHLNHQLRGDESDEDEVFVQGLQAFVGSSTAAVVALRCDRIDVRGAAAGGNLEETARRIRYEWLAGVARVTGSGWVATGHTADDQAETVLHRLLRGTGLQGLRGIAERRTLSEGVDLVRPMLAVTRAEVMAYLEEIGQSYRLDSSNADLSLTRNRIRRELLPHLAEEYNPGIVGILTRLADQASEAFAEEEAAAMALLAEVELPRAGTWLVLDRQRLRTVSRRRVREVFRLVWRREGWPTGKMDYDHWDRLAGLVFGEAAALELPDGLQAQSRERTVLLSPPRQQGIV